MILSFITNAGTIKLAPVLQIVEKGGRRGRCPHRPFVKCYEFAQIYQNTGVFTAGRCRHRPLQFRITGFIDTLKFWGDQTCPSIDFYTKKSGKSPDFSMRLQGHFYGFLNVSYPVYGKFLGNIQLFRAALGNDTFLKPKAGHFGKAVVQIRYAANLPC